jgi:hypothetical protein
VSGRSSASAQTPASERVRERSRVSDAHRRSPHSRAVANAGTCLARMRQCGRRSSAPVSWTPTTSKHARAESSSVLRASETVGPPVESSHDHANAQLHAHGATQQRPRGVDAIAAHARFGLTGFASRALASPRKGSSAHFTSGDRIRVNPLVETPAPNGAAEKLGRSSRRDRFRGRTPSRPTTPSATSRSLGASRRASKRRRAALGVDRLCMGRSRILQACV